MILPMLSCDLDAHMHVCVRACARVCGGVGRVTDRGGQVEY